MRELLGALLVTACLGCGGVASNLHVVSSTGGGELVDASQKSRRGLSPTESAAYIDRILDQIESAAPLQNGKRQVLLYVHGGLKNYTQSYQHAEEVREQILADGLYPIFVVWPSNFERAYTEHLIWIRQGRKSRFMGPVTAPFFLAGDLATGIIRAPGTIVQQMTSGVGTWGERTTTYRRNSTVREENLAPHVGTPHGLNLIPGQDRRGGWDKAGRLGLYFLTLPAKVVTAVLLDSFGEPAYDNMLRRTETPFRRAEVYEREFNERATAPAFVRDGQGDGAVAAFVRALQARSRRVPMEITLVGHSMGTMVANRILETAPDLPIRNLVYLGAACTFDDFVGTVIPFLERHPQAHFYNLTLHPMAESRETNWKSLDLLPRGSLLEWIDNFLANPRFPSQRVLGKWENVMMSSHLIPVSVRDQITIRSFDAGGGEHPQKHGELNDHPYWRQSYWTGQP